MQKKRLGLLLIASLILFMAVFALGLNVLMPCRKQRIGTDPPYGMEQL